MLILSLIILITCKAFNLINLNYTFYTRVSTIILISSSILIYNTLDLTFTVTSGIGIYGGLYHVTLASQIMELFLLIIGSLILISWPIKNIPNNVALSLLNNSHLDNFENNKSKINTLLTDINYLKNSINYSIIVVFSSLGASLLLSSWDLISMYISIELQSFSLYVLSTLYKDSEKSTSAGLKYFLIGGLASCLILLGSGLIYSSLGLTNFDSIFNILSVHMLYELKNFNLGILIIFVGFLIKIAAAPLHNWSPDVYDNTPTIVTIWLTIIPKISILIFLLEIYCKFNLDYHSLGLEGYVVNLNLVSSERSIFSITDLLNNNLIKYLLLIISLSSLIIGGIVGLVQKRIKRLLAYSTISHLGFILLALTIFSSQSIESFIFYIIQYSLTNLNIFLIIIALSYLNQNIINKKLINNNNFLFKGITDINLISEFKGQFFKNPLISICFSICLFSLAGIPPLIGFFSKQFVLLSAIQEGYYFISLVGIIVSVISASYYLKIIKEIYYETIVDSNNLITNNNLSGYSPTINNNIKGNYQIDTYILSNFHSYLISVLTLFIIFFIFKPSLILNPTFWVVTTIFPII